jgi:hypothetical protein
MHNYQQARRPALKDLTWDPPSTDNVGFLSLGVFILKCINMYLQQQDDVRYSNSLQMASQSLALT